MANLISQKASFGADPTEGFVQYTEAVKPYHTKILEVLIEYVYKEDIVATINERWNWNIDLTRPQVDVVPTCGFGVVWDSPFATDDYPTAVIKQAVGDTPIEITLLSDVLNPTHILISYNPDGYLVNVGDPITFQFNAITTEDLPTTTTGTISPGKIYYVTSISGNVLEVSNTLAGAPLSFLTAGSGTVLLHLENLPYNSFLVEQPAPVQFQCIATNTKANQLSFINAYNVAGVNPSLKQWTVNTALLSSAHQTATLGVTKIGTDSTGLLNDATIYTATISVDGVATPIAITGSTAQTFTSLIAELNTDLGAAATATLTVDGIKITSTTVGGASSISITDVDLFSSLLNFGGIASEINDTVAIPGKVLYVHDNTGASTNGVYTIASVTQVGSVTTITTVEQISLLAQVNGTINIQDDLSLTPRWIAGTKVTISTSGTLPAPLSSSQPYYFIPTNDIGVFNLSLKQFPTSMLDVIDLTTLGSSVINISRAELFYPGAIVNVTSTYLGRNNGTFYIKSVTNEGSYSRVTTQQAVTRTTPSAITNDGFMVLDSHVGYDYPQYCAIIQAPDLYVDTFIHERIAFEFVLDFTDQIASHIFEDDAGVHGNVDFYSTTVTGAISHTILPTGYDTQFFGLGVIDEDSHYVNHNLGKTI